MLRDLGRDLEHEPPATLAHQRRRLLDAPARPRWRPLRAVRGWTALALAAGVTAAVAVVPTVVVLGGRQSVPAPAGDRPDKPSKALNVLVVGTDSQAGTPRLRHPDRGVLSDTMILLHLSADRKKVQVVNIPRDSIVKLPACESADGKTVPARTDMINAAFRTGGLSCAWKAVESTTKVRVDHAIEIEFSGLEDMVDALGGVEVTLAAPVDDRKSKLKLPAGKHLLNGEQAVGYVRLRNYGDGSDLQRIRRQQRFMNAMVKKAAERLADPTWLPGFLGAVTASVKTDKGLDARTMYTIARGFKGTEPGSVTFTTVPTRPHPNDPNRLQWDAPAAERLFAALRSDAG
ncbi:hypothetical protein GCM10010517_33400 [Streptosporangium fragile]|uniref:Cell envelope-related transcriptional attenuator domain-containing protein n=2 Tax=Streptosporangium fragile TaxID=46186 RepID=A0ABN3VY32_9ACTN